MHVAMLRLSKLNIFGPYARCMQIRTVKRERERKRKEERRQIEATEEKEGRSAARSQKEGKRCEYLWRSLLLSRRNRYSMRCGYIVYRGRMEKLAELPFSFTRAVDDTNWAVQDVTSATGSQTVIA